MAIRNILFVVTLLLLPVYAAEIPVLDVTPSSTWSTYNVINLINGAGLSGDLHDGLFEHKWMTNGTPTGWLIFDLGQSLQISSTKIWNYGPGCCGNERSTRDLGILWSLNGVDYFTLGNYVLDQPQTDPFPGQVLAMGVNARYVRFDLNSTWGQSEYIGLSEVKFFGEEAVPEPGGAALMLIGLGTLVWWRRVRRT